MILSIGVSTSKLFLSDLPSDDPQQPWLVDVAADLSDMSGRTVDFSKRTVRLPKDAAVQDAAAKVHKIGTRSARKNGAAQKWSGYGLIEMQNEARIVVSYGDMTRKVVTSVIERVAGRDADQWLAQWLRAGVEWPDIRTSATIVCKLPHDGNVGNYRWPSRAEAAAAILDPGELASLAAEERFGAAWANCMTDKAIYLALRQRQILEEAA